MRRGYFTPAVETAEELRRCEYFLENSYAAPRTVFPCGDVTTQTYQDGASLSTVSPEASHPRAHARQLALRNVLAPVVSLPGSTVVFFVPQVRVWAVSVSQVPRATARRLPALHHLAHQVRIFAVLLWDR
jgi:hypothetical protein